MRFNSIYIGAVAAYALFTLAYILYLYRANQTRFLHALQLLDKKDVDKFLAEIEVLLDHSRVREYRNKYLIYKFIGNMRIGEYKICDNLLRVIRPPVSGSALHTQFQVNRMLFYYAANQKEKLQAEYSGIRTYLERHASASWLHFLDGIIAFQMQELDKSREELEQAEDAELDYFSCAGKYYHLGIIALKQDYLDRCQRYMQKAKELGAGTLFELKSVSALTAFTNTEEDAPIGTQYDHNQQEEET